MRRSLPACTVISAPSSRRAGGAAVLEDLYPVQPAGRPSVVALPGHVGVSNAGQVLDEPLPVINRGATSLIAYMTATVSCDHADAAATKKRRRHN